jgi:hypothetical protein
VCSYWLEERNEEEEEGWGLSINVKRAPISCLGLDFLFIPNREKICNKIGHFATVVS